MSEPAGRRAGPSTQTVSLTALTGALLTSLPVWMPLWASTAHGSDERGPTVRLPSSGYEKMAHHPRAASKEERCGPNAVFNLGPTGIWAVRQPKSASYRVTDVAPGSPGHGKIAAGDVIYGAHGGRFSEMDIDPHLDAASRAPNPQSAVLVQRFAGVYLPPINALLQFESGLTPRANEAIFPLTPVRRMPGPATTFPVGPAAPPASASARPRTRTHLSCRRPSSRPFTARGRTRSSSGSSERSAGSFLTTSSR